MPAIGAIGGMDRPAWAVEWPWVVGLAAVGTVALAAADTLDPGVMAALLAGLGVVALGLALLRPSLDYRLVDRPMGRLVAFVGCDGSGKSTLTGDLQRTLTGTGAAGAGGARVATCYLGLGSGALGERLKRAPLLGPALERRLARKAATARTAGQKIPGLATALVIYLFSLARLRRFKRMLRLRRAGYLVLTDRYPQTEFPGFYDGPGLAAGQAGSWAVARLVRAEQRIYRWMAAFHPDVVVRLNVDAATALARKPEHRAELVRRKVAITPRLRFAGARIVDLDATQPYALVRAAAARVVDGTLGRRAAA